MALGDQDLGPDQVKAGDHLGDRVLHLDSRVHLDEEPLVPVEIVEELDGASVIVADLAGDARGGITQFLDDVLGKSEGRRDLDHLLMAPLHRAIALVQMDDIAVAVAEDLHLDVLGARDVLLQEDRGIAEGALGLALRLVEQSGQFRLLLHHPHAAAAATEGGLDDEREPDFLRLLERQAAIGDGLVRAGKDGNLDAHGHGAGRGLVAHHVQQLGSRADKGDALAGAGAGKGGILGEESISRMNGVDALFLGHGHDALDVQIRGHRPPAAADEIRLIRLEPVDPETVLLRVHGDRAQPQLRGRAKNADGDLRTIGRHQLSKRALGSLRGGGWGGEA